VGGTSVAALGRRVDEQPAEFVFTIHLTEDTWLTKLLEWFQCKGGHLYALCPVELYSNWRQAGAPGGPGMNGEYPIPYYIYKASDPSRVE